MWVTTDGRLKKPARPTLNNCVVEGSEACTRHVCARARGPRMRACGLRVRVHARAQHVPPVPRHRAQLCVEALTGHTHRRMRETKTEPTREWGHLFSLFTKLPRGACVLPSACSSPLLLTADLKGSCACVRPRGACAEEGEREKRQRSRRKRIEKAGGCVHDFLFVWFACGVRTRQDRCAGGKRG